MKISIAYAVPGRQILLPLTVPDGSTIRSAIEQSGILEQLPHFDFSRQKVGIFGKTKQPDTVLAEGDRVEIYQPATADPKVVLKRKDKDKDKDKDAAKE